VNVLLLLTEQFERVPMNCELLLNSRFAIGLENSPIIQYFMLQYCLSLLCHNFVGAVNIFVHI